MKKAISQEEGQGLDVLSFVMEGSFEGLHYFTGFSKPVVTIP
jgi:hypothetical protein